MQKKQTYNDKQAAALVRFNEPKMYYLCYGGSRSGKTWLICKYIILKAMKVPKSRHLICRLSKASCISTVWTQTLLPMLECYPGVWVEDKTNRIIKFANGSEIRSGGFDNKIHEDAILGSEFATIYVNEVIELSYAIFSKLRSRLNAKDVSLKFFLDCNPKAPSHWVHKFFIKHIEPESGEKLDKNIADSIDSLYFHPKDNIANLNDKYMEQLSLLKGLARKRFYDGEWAEDAEGLVYYGFDRKTNVVENEIAYIPTADTFTAWDFGTADPTFIIVGQILNVPKTDENKKGLVINIIDEYTNNNQSVEHYGLWCKSRPWFGNTMRRDYGDPAGKNRDANLSSWITSLWNYGIQVQYVSSYKIEEYIDDANDIVYNVRVCEKQCPKIVEMFENWKYPLELDGKKKVGVKPNHDIYSHPGTAFYYFAAQRFGKKVGKLIV